MRVPENGRDLYTREVLNSLYALITDLKKVTAEHNDETFSFQDVCPKSVQKGFENQCQVPRADLRPSVLLASHKSCSRTETVMWFTSSSGSLV